MILPQRGEVWLVDLGLAGKIRPCLVLSIRATELDERALTTIIPHTTSCRGGRFEVGLQVPFLKPGAFDVQNVITIPSLKLSRKLGRMTVDQLALIEDALRLWLGLS
jgi:mRNA interferase MazF